MGRGVGVWMVGALLLLAPATAVWAAHELTEDELRTEMEANRELRTYVERNGLPDVAESRPLADRPPWDDHEVTLYYVDRGFEIGFARAYILGKPDVQIFRYERPLTDGQIAALSARPKMVPSSSGGRALGPSSGTGPDERAEAAARRAENAASRIEATVPKVEHAADRAEAVASRMERGFHESLRK